MKKPSALITVGVVIAVAAVAGLVAPNEHPSKQQNVVSKAVHNAIIQHEAEHRETNGESR